MAKPRLLLLVTPPTEGEFHNDNHERLHAAFLSLGWDVAIEPHTYLLAHKIDHYDFIWPVGFGPRRDYDKRVAALSGIPSNQIVTPSMAQRDLHAKSAWLTHAPETYTSHDPAEFSKIVEQGQQWVLKPDAGSFGRSVRKISAVSQLPTETNNQELWLLQRYIPEIVEGEYRTVIIGSEVIGTYKRVPDGDFRANLSQQGHAVASVLPDDHLPIVLDTHQQLLSAHVGFAAIDTCAGYIMEVNVANPGGLQTLEQLSGHEVSTRLVSACLLLVKERS